MSHRRHDEKVTGNETEKTGKEGASSSGWKGVNYGLRRSSLYLFSLIREKNS